MKQTSGYKPLLSVRLSAETDIVGVRQRARQVAAIVGLPKVDQVSFATAVSEIARAARETGLRSATFELNVSARPQVLAVQISGRESGGPSLEERLTSEDPNEASLQLSIAGARRLADRWELASSPETGTLLRFGKCLPKVVDAAEMSRIAARLAEQVTTGAMDALTQQNQELLETLETLRSREAALDARKVELERLSLELDETNRGVVALYAELEERAVALRRADELKSQFISHVSHEFRTPVNSIMALSHLLLRQTDGVLTSEQEKQVSFIREAAKGLSDMVNDLLDLAKVESGKTAVRHSLVEVSQVLGAVRALMRPLAVNEETTLVFEENPGGAIITDEAKLGQILRNLVSNALKFTERGEVRVSARYSPDRKWIRFAVADTGIGIAPEHLDVVFQEFSQVDHRIQGRVKGTGLGLSLSRKLAGLLGGTLEVTSELGRGSTFVLALPVEVPETAAEAASPAYASISEEPSILIVDDDPASRYVCRQMFRGSRYRVIESDGYEAAERARFERPVLVLLDLMMPGRNGFEVLDELKSDPATRDIPVVIHTSKSITDADRHRLSGRHLGVIPKSGQNRKEALAAIRQALNDPELFSGEAEFVYDS